MATDKPRITAYVRQDLFDKFDKFCSQSEVSHSKGIELILAEYFTGNEPDVTLNPLANLGMDEEKLTALIDERLARTILSGNSLVTDAKLDKAIVALIENEQFIEAIAAKLLSKRIYE